MRALLVLALLTACPTEEEPPVEDDVQEDADDFADRLSEDLADLNAAMEQVAASADDLEERDEARRCYPTVGNCSVCFDLLGTPAQGTFTSEIEDSPCGRAIEIAGRTLNYSIAESDLQGNWQATGLGGDYDILASGERASTLDIQSARRGVVNFDSTWFLDDLSATVEDLSVTEWSFTLTYGSFAGQEWVATIGGDVVSVSGTVSSDHGFTCTVSGSYETPNVSCTAG